MGEEAKNLLHAFMHQSLTEAEWQTLLSDIRENREQYTALDNWWPIANAAIPESRKQALLSQILQQTPPATAPRRPTRLPRSRRVRKAMAWGVPLCLFITGVTLYIANRHPLQTPVADVLPPQANTVLTLSNGRQVTLAANQPVTITDGGSAITNLQNGTVQYTAQPTTQPAAINTLQTKAGTTYKVILADGTQVWLNNTSTLQYPVQFTGSTREVVLTGEAYFEIAQNARQPFIVKAGHQHVEVLGTHFNINAYHAADSIVTTLLTGKIKVYDSRRPQQAVVVQPQQQTVFQHNQVALATVTADTTIAMGWKSGRFSFNNATVTEALDQLARWYNIQVHFEGAVPSRRITGQVYRNLRLSEVLELLRYSGIECYIQDKTIVVPAQ